MKQMQQWIAANPSGILVYHPPGRQFTFVKSLAIEFSTEVIQAILVIRLLTQTRIQSFGGRVGFVLFAGVLAAITTNVSYWNWYGFPWRLHRQLCTDRSRRLRSRWSYCRSGTAKA